MRIVFKMALAAALFLGCGPMPDDGRKLVTDEALDTPLRGVTEAERAAFFAGDATFDAMYRPVDGLGPLYIRGSCASCHEEATNGPGVVEKMAAVYDDGITPKPVDFPYGRSVRPYVTAGATTPVEPGPDLKVTQRVGLPILGRGYLEAIRDDEIERVEALQSERARRGESQVTGRINRVTRHSQANPDDPTHHLQFGDSGLVGRFGAKARVATLDDFAADALQGDMGMTSPLRPEELPNPDGLTDDLHPGIDVDLDTVNALATYVRLVEIPQRQEPDPAAVQLFSDIGCAECHVPSLHTRADYPIGALADIDAPVYTDLLLHEMGTALSDGLEDEDARSTEWRTAPLIGLRFLRAYMHDSRAQTIDEAIRAHQSEGSEANASVDRYLSLSAEERQRLTDFVGSL
ncbi:MAG: hypothetical protein IRZ16_10570 [Myxococcaceae bacterium]|nr:hypothetical protein [Myxococcaceae bacterium]